MVANDSGFQKLYILIEHIVKTSPAGFDKDVLGGWYESRYREIQAELRGLCACPEVAHFSNANAKSLADELQEMLTESEAVEAPIDFVDALLKEAHAFAESMQRDGSAPAVDPLESVASGIAANSNLAQAA